MEHPSQAFQIWNTKQERNKSLKIKNLVADNIITIFYWTFILN